MKRSIFYGLLLALTTLTSSYSNKPETLQPTNTSIYNALAALHNPALEDNTVTTPHTSNKKQAKPTDKYAVSSLSRNEIMAIYYNYFGMHEPAFYLPTIASDAVFNDLELFAGNKPYFKDHVFEKLNKTITIAGNIALQKRLYSPTNNPAALHAMQEIIREFITNKAMVNTITTLLKEIHATEAEFAWFYKDMERETLAYFEKVYFSASEIGLFDFYAYNDNPSAMQALSVANLGKDVSLVIMPQVLAAISNGIIMGAVLSLFGSQRSLRSCVVEQLECIYNPVTYYKAANRYFGPSGAILFTGLWAVGRISIIMQLKTAVYAALEKLETMHNIEEKMVKISRLFNACEKIADLVATSPIHEHVALLGKSANTFGSMAHTDATTDLTSLIKPLHPATQEPPLFTRGTAMASFSLARKRLAAPVEKLKFAGFIDSFVSTATLLTEHADKPGTFCLPEIIESTTPTLTLNDYWHPYLNPATVIPNTMLLGNKQAKTAVITGPNKGGKSTGLKALMYSVLLAQTLGIAPARHMSLTPFSNLNTYLNVADKQGSDSLFEAEMKKTKHLLDTIEQQKPHDFSFVIIDELFTGTNPHEGMAAAFGTVQKLTTLESCLAIVATHFIELTNIANVANYKVSVARINNKIVPLYTIKPGIADQTIAIDLLKEEGFDATIIAAAESILGNNTP